MKIEVTKYTQRKETIEVSFPYYYKHDLMMDDVDIVIYGKVEQKKHTRITIRDFGEIQFELHIERGPRVTYSYREDQYTSSEAEYLAAKAKLLKAAQDA